ncbi:transposase [Elizabethkingia sp. JS20170427COW]|uniref:transposase n=1 Tax=Elizabethkingia sp. JS20170427COW TaxID=2583851 RepID=UPI00111009E1|nr:transposase [Elizabethkingia sp. JS20170427COW]QCX52814.1 transposase [Elizabethkingia sp. JS20170427COW]
MNFKQIHIGSLIHQKVDEEDIDMVRISNFLKCTEEEVTAMYQQENLPTDILLKWSKLLEYDFFRIYSQHLILYAPSSVKREKKQSQATQLPVFRKNIYTKEIIDFIVELINTHKKTKKQIIEEYNIPKTTLYKWLMKNQSSSSEKNPPQ